MNSSNPANDYTLVVQKEPAKKRPCRDLNVLKPTDFVLETFSHRRVDAYNAYRERGFKELRLAPSQRGSAGKTVHHAGNKPRHGPGATDRPTESLLKKKRKRYMPEDPAYISPLTQVDSTACVTSILAAAFRCNANHVAVVKASKDGGNATSQLQQTTRVQTGGPALTSAVQQVTNRIVVGLAQGEAALRCKKVEVARPECALQPSMARAVEWARSVDAGAAGTDDAIIWTMPCRHMAGIAPRSLKPSDMLKTMILISQKELKQNLISSVVPQSTRHLELTCKNICDARDGSRLWFSLKLLDYMVKGDFRLHSILVEHGITDFDYALAASLCFYASSLVSNRARQLIESFDEYMQDRSKSYGMQKDEIKSAIDEAWDDIGQLSGKIPELTFQELRVETERRRNLVCARSKSQKTAVDRNAGKRNRVVSVQSVTTTTAVTEGVNGKPDVSQCNSTALAVVVLDNVSTEHATSEPSVDDNAAPERHRRAPRARASMSGAPHVKELEMFHCHFGTNMSSDLIDDDDGSIMANCSLKHLVSEQPAASRESATAILKWQLSQSGIELNSELLEESQSAALHTRGLLMRLLRNDESCCPVACLWSARVLGQTREFVGVGHRPAGGTMFMLATRPPAKFQPPDNKSAILWSDATFRSKDSYASEDAVPAHAVVGCAEALADLNGAIKTKSQRDVAMARRAHASLSESVKSTTASGLTRSVLLFDAILPLGSETRGAVEAVTESMVSLAEAERNGNEQVSAGSVVIKEERSLDVSTPPCVPSNPLIVGFNMSEAMRFSYSNIAKEQDICLVSLVPPTETPFSETTPKLINPNSRPWAMMHVMDINVERGDVAERVTTLSGNRCIFETSARISCAVCADCPIPVTKAVECFAGTIADALASKTGEAQPTALLRQMRAVLLMAGVQCHTVNTLANACASRNLNTCIENTSRVKDPDNHRCLNSTLYQAYVTGSCNVEPQFQGTPWHGAYGSVFDCGSVASVGQRAKHLVSDDRLPVRPLMVDQDQVNDFSVRFAPFTYAPVVSPAWNNKRRFHSTPMECWGLPRYLIPGFHMALDSLCDAYTFLREASGTSDHDTVMSIQVLPLSPFSEAVPPIFRGAQWNGFRSQPVSPSTPIGWSTFQADATLPEASVMNGPLLNGCRVHSTQPMDNFFENCNTNTSVVLLVVSMIDTIARSALRIHGKSEVEIGEATTDEAMDTLYSCIRAFHDSYDGDSHEQPEEWQSTLACDALVLFNVLAPQSFAISEYVVLTAYSLAPHAVTRQSARSLGDVPGLSEEDVRDARRYWSRLGDRSNARGFWRSTVDLVEEVRKRGTTFSNSLADMGGVAEAMERWVRSIWYLHSDDGVTVPGEWSPLHHCASPEAMTSLDVLGVFADRPLVLQANRRVQRGALFGLDYNSLNQVLSLLNSSHLSGTIVNCARNEGSICLRPSCNALKRDDRGRRPSAKSTSPTYDDNDVEASGTIEAREESARRQAEAWRKNNEHIFNMTKRAHFKPNYSGSLRGSRLSHTKHSQMDIEKQTSHLGSSDYVTEEDRRMHEAAEHAWVKRVSRA